MLRALFMILFPPHDSLVMADRDLDARIVRTQDGGDKQSVLNELEGGHGLDLVLLRCLAVYVHVHLCTFAMHSGR